MPDMDDRSINNAESSPIIGDCTEPSSDSAKSAANSVESPLACAESLVAYTESPSNCVKSPNDSAESHQDVAPYIETIETDSQPTIHYGFGPTEPSNLSVPLKVEDLSPITARPKGKEYLKATVNELMRKQSTPLTIKQAIEAFKAKKITQNELFPPRLIHARRASSSNALLEATNVYENGLLCPTPDIHRQRSNSTIQSSSPRRKSLTKKPPLIRRRSTVHFDKQGRVIVRKRSTEKRPPFLNRLSMAQLKVEPPEQEHIWPKRIAFISASLLLIVCVAYCFIYCLDMDSIFDYVVIHILDR